MTGPQAHDDEDEDDFVPAGLAQRMLEPIDPLIAHDVAIRALADRMERGSYMRACTLIGTALATVNETRIVVDHRHLRGTTAKRIGIETDKAVRHDPTGRQPAVATARLDTFLDRAVADVHRRTVREAELRTTGHIPAGHDDSGQPVVPAPSWSTLVHPLLLHALIRSTHAHDRQIHAPGESPTGANTTHEHDLVIGGAMAGSDPEDRSTWTIRPYATTVGAGLSILRGIPISIAQALAGRPLSDLLVLPSCGRRDVDAAVASLVIASARTKPEFVKLTPSGNPIGPFPNPTNVVLRPTTWLTRDPIPSGVHARFHIDHPYVR